MTEQNAEKAMAKLGAVTKSAGIVNRTLTVKIGEFEIECRCQDGEVRAIHTQKAMESADLLTDYFPGDYWKSLASALRFVNRRNGEN